MNQIFVDDFITIKELLEEDAENFTEAINRNVPNLTPWFIWAHKDIILEDQLEFIRRSRKLLETGEAYEFIIIYKTNLVGSIAINKIDKIHKVCNMSYWIDKEYQGKGIMTKSCKVILKFIFETLKLHRVELRIAKDNYKSQQLAHRLNFTNEGILRKFELSSEGFRDMFIYSLLSEEFISFFV